MERSLEDMAENSKIADFETMIEGLKKYQSSLREECEEIRETVEKYARGVGDKPSEKVYEKVQRISQKIDPEAVEKVQKLKKNLEEQLEIIRRGKDTERYIDEI